MLDRVLIPLDGSPLAMKEAADSLIAGGLRTDVAVRRGDAALGILEAGAELGCDLIAMTTHGRSGLSRWVFGSVTEKVLRAAAVPLLVARP